MRLLGCILALLMLCVLTACSSDEQSSADSDETCEQIVRQMNYEALQQLAAAGLAKNPCLLREAMKSSTSRTEAPRVALPDYESFSEDYTDGEQATLWSALTSVEVGVGRWYDAAEATEAAHRSGACPGGTR